MTKIAKADQEAMNFLYAQALGKTATPVDSIATDQAIEDHAEQNKVRDAVLKEDAKDMKTAAKNEGWTDQAFKDHEEYLDTLEDILKEDDKQGFDPNDIIQD